jgi:hypothetical protein
MLKIKNIYTDEVIESIKFNTNSLVMRVIFEYLGIEGVFVTSLQIRKDGRSEIINRFSICINSDKQEVFKTSKKLNIDISEISTNFYILVKDEIEKKIGNKANEYGI